MKAKYTAAALPQARRAAREFSFTPQDFENVRRLIHVYAGISLNSHKQDMVYSRLVRRVRATGLHSFEHYLALVENGDSVEREAFTNALTTNLTSFFREQHHFPELAAHILKHKDKHPITVWCAASSTGEEAYSIAITLAEALDSLAPNVRIIASDLDTSVLQKARDGIYPMDRIEMMSSDRIRRFFLKGVGANAGYARVRDELRNMIVFRQINLLDDEWPIRGPLDAIFCRNVMIYFDHDTQYRILERFAPLLRTDGLLFAGHSENFHHAAGLLRPCGRTVYQLVDQAENQRLGRQESRGSAR